MNDCKDSSDNGSEYGGAIGGLGVYDGGECDGMTGGECKSCGCTGPCNCASEETAPYTGGYGSTPCGSYGGYVSGGSFMSTTRMILSNDWVKALVIVFLVLLLFSLYHYGKNTMYMRRYRMPSLRRRFPHFSSSRP